MLLFSKIGVMILNFRKNISIRKAQNRCKTCSVFEEDENYRNAQEKT